MNYHLIFHVTLTKYMYSHRENAKCFRHFSMAPGITASSLTPAKVIAWYQHLSKDDPDGKCCAAPVGHCPVEHCAYFINEDLIYYTHSRHIAAPPAPSEEQIATWLSDSTRDTLAEFMALTRPEPPLVTPLS